QEVVGEVREQTESEETQTQAQGQQIVPEVAEIDCVVFGQASTPEQNVAAKRASYKRITEGMTQEQIDADTDLVRMREQIEGVQDLSRAIGVNSSGQEIYKVKPDSGYYVFTQNLVNGDNIEGYTEAPDAKRLTGYDTQQLFYNKTEDGVYHINDSQTGAGLVEGASLKDARQKLDSLISSLGSIDLVLNEGRRRFEGVLNRTTSQVSSQAESTVQQNEVFMEPEQSEIVNTEDP